MKNTNKKEELKEVIKKAKGGESNKEERINKRKEYKELVRKKRRGG